MPVFRYISVLFLLAAFLLQTFNRTALVVDYYANTDSFIKNCVNKYRPQLHCKGQCQLMKKLRSLEEKEGKSPERKWTNSIEVLSSKSFFAVTELPAALPFRPDWNMDSAAPPVDRSFTFFHPPTLV